MKVLARLNEITEEQWLEIRRGGIGASEVAGIMGYSPWQSPLSIYFEKITGDNTREESLPMELGKELEPFMRRKFTAWLQEHEGVEGIEFSEKCILQHDEYSFIRCSPDDLFYHPLKGDLGVEYKTAGEYQRDKWSDDEVPDQYYFQVQHCMAVTGFKEWYLAYLLGNRKFEVVPILRNEGIIQQIIEQCNSFWTDFVIPQVPPAPGGMDIDGQVLKSLYPEGEGTVELPHLESKYDQLKKLKAEENAAKDLYETIKQEVQAEMKDAEVAILGEKENGKPKKATWKLQKGGKEVSYIKKDSRVFRVS